MSLTNTNSTIDELHERIIELQLALDISSNDKNGLQTTLDSTRLALNNEKEQNQLLRERVQTLQNEISSENEAVWTEVEGQLLECHRILEIEHELNQKIQELNQKIQELNQDKQNMQDRITNLSRDLSTVEIQKTDMERTSNKQKKDISSLVIKLDEVENEKQNSEDLVRPLLMKMDSFDELLARNGDVNSDLQNQLPHLQAMSTESEEQHAHSWHCGTICQSCMKDNCVYFKRQIENRSFKSATFPMCLMTSFHD